MQLSAVPGARVEVSGYEASYTLPLRPLGKLRWFALIPIVFGAFFVSVPIELLSELLPQIASSNAGWGAWFIVLFMVPFLVGGLTPIAFGLMAAVGHCRVDWRDKRLSVVEVVGPFRWRRRLPNLPVRKLTVNIGGTKVNGKPVTTGPLAELGALSAELGEAKPRLLVLGYPHAWLQALANDLSMRIGAAASVAAPRVAVIDADLDDPRLVDIDQRPADSQVEVQRRASGVVLTIPPAGVRKGSQGMLGFGVLWCLFMTVFTGMPIVLNTKGHEAIPWGAWLFIAVFWLVGVSFIVAAVNMGRRHATLSVESGALHVKQVTLFGVKEHRWRGGEIAAIRADASGMEVNDHPILELQIHPTLGKKVGCFSGRDEQELRWMATELRRALKVPAQS
jgi:hypothetical protein